MLYLVYYTITATDKMCGCVIVFGVHLSLRKMPTLRKISLFAFQELVFTVTRTPYNQTTSNLSMHLEVPLYR